MPQKSEYVQFKHYEKKIKSPFIIYADFEIMLLPEDKVKQNPEESCRSKYQKNSPSSYGYKLVCVNDKFSEPFQTDLGKDTMYHFINNMIEENNFCSDVMKKHFNKELLFTKEDKKNSNNSTKCSICDNNFINNVVKVR